MRSFSAWFSLFASTSTLLCCALPSFLVVLGLGATMAGLVSTFPQIVWLSEHKFFIFTFSGLMIFVAAYLQYRASFEACPTDPELAKTCMKNRRLSLVIWCLSAILWSTGAFFAFLAPKLFS